MSTDAPPSVPDGGASAPRPGFPWTRAAFLAGAAGAWIWSALAHDYGTDVAHDYFEWAKKPGHLSAEGGAHGVRAAELAAESFMAVVSAVLAWLTVLRFRGAPRGAAARHALAWSIWGAVVYLFWKCYINFASELIHFGQYAIVAGLLYAGLRGRSRAVVAFLVAMFLGVVDESWQNWGIAYRQHAFYWHSLEWSDTMLDAAGACGGVLLLVGPSHGDDVDEAPQRLLHRVVAAFAVVSLPLLLLSRVTLARIFGSYSYYPTWNEYDIGKAAHWMTPFDGIPLLAATVLLLGRLVSGARALVTRGVALALLLLGIVAVDRPSLHVGRLVHEVVPTAVAPRVPVGRIQVDGALDEPEWARAPRVGPFVRNEPVYPDHPLPADALAPLYDTRARFLWDERALYVAFESASPDVWARRLAHDDPSMPGDEVVELFIDPDGDEITYYEFEINPLGAVYDLFNYVPQTPSDMDATQQFAGLADWDAKGLACAVKVDGTLDVVEDFAPARPTGKDRGWTVEIAIPWTVFRTTTTPSARTRLRLPPKPGDRWRVGLYRIARPRVSTLDGHVYSRGDAEHVAQYQAWSPSRVASFHKPERFGVVEFADER
jgi:hypothetical protein